MVMVAGCVAPAAPAPDMADTEMMEVVSSPGVTLTDDAAPLDKQVYRFAAVEGKHLDTMRNEYEGFAYESTIEQLAKMGPEGIWHPAAADSWEQVEVPFARDGMYDKEFPVMFDWMHNGGGFSIFFCSRSRTPTTWRCAGAWNASPASIWARTRRPTTMTLRIASSAACSTAAAAR